MTLFSSRLCGPAEEPTTAVSSTSESGDLFFHSGNEYDLVRTTGNLERVVVGDFGIRTHSLSNLTTRLACSGKPSSKESSRITAVVVAILEGGGFERRKYIKMVRQFFWSHQFSSSPFNCPEDSAPDDRNKLYLSSYVMLNQTLASVPVSCTLLKRRH